MAYSILIVDDDRTFVEELKSALQWNRLRITEVYTAFSVREAIAFLSKTKADIVLCDIEMPGGNGLQLLKWIRENHASMECIVLSSYAEFSYAQSALRFDVCDYLLKPIKAKELEETISRVVGLLDARRGWQEEPLETLWAALFDGAVKQADFTRQAQKHGLTENSSLAILLLRFVPVPGQPVPSHYGRPLVRQAILDLADQNALQTVVRLRPDGSWSAVPQGKIPFLARRWRRFSTPWRRGSAFRSVHTAEKKAPSGRQCPCGRRFASWKSTPFRICRESRRESTCPQTRHSGALSP